MSLMRQPAARRPRATATPTLPAPDHRRPPALVVGAGAKHGREPLDRAPTPHCQHPVSRLRACAATRQNQLLVAANGHEQHVLRELGLAQGAFGDLCALFDGVTQQRDLAPRELVYVEGPGHGDDARDLRGQLLGRANHYVDAQSVGDVVFFTEQALAVQDADAAFGSQSFCREASHDVALVVAAGSDEGVGFVELRLLQDVLGGDATEHQLHVEALGERLDLCLGPEEHHRVLGHQGLGDACAGHVVASHSDVHSSGN